MELIQGTHKASKFAPESLDFISNMPDNVVTDILNRLPLQDAVRTGILSRNWRFKWTMLSHLVFDENFIDYLIKNERQNNYATIISQLLLLIKGAITKFVLYTDTPMLDNGDISNWILFLSTKGVKDLTIWNRRYPLKLPSHLFSCLELKHLELHGFPFVPPASFRSFPNLLSLKLRIVKVKSNGIGDFVNWFPLLEILDLGFVNLQRPLKLLEIAKLTNLKILTLFLFNLKDTMIKSSSCIIELVGSFPKLQQLHLDFWGCGFIAEHCALRRAPTPFYGLKTLLLSNIDLENDIVLSFIFDIIRSSPNMQTLEIMAHKQDGVPPPATCSLEVDYKTMELLQLRSVVFTDFKASMNEVCLIKYLLARSSFLKRIVIHPLYTLKSKEKLMFAMKLLALHRASTVAEINLN